MKLWLDGQCLQTASRVRGIGRYALGLIEGLATSQPDVELTISFNAAMPVEAIAARDAVSEWIEPRNIYVWQGVAEGGEATSGYSAKRRLSEIALTHHVACISPDVALSASPMEGQLDVAVPLPPGQLGDIPMASIFYDAIPHRYPDQYLQDNSTLNYYKRRFSGYSSFDLNLCISEFCRRECVELTGNTNSVDIGAGISTSIRKAIATGIRFPDQMRGKFALYVGALDWRKNPQIVTAAFARLPTALRHSTRLVVAGPDDSHMRDDFVAGWTTAGLPRENLELVERPNDSILAQLYHSAAVVIQPSLMEGFGLTALEAMHAGTAVLASDIPALREIAQRDEMLFDPASPRQLATKLEALLTDRPTAEENRAYGIERARYYSWHRSAKLAFNAFQHLVANKRASSSDEIATARVRLLPSLARLKLADSLKAETLARAEPLDRESTRLIIDATYTSQSDQRTGIQRVVKNIARELSSHRPQTSVTIGYCDEDAHWYALKPGPNGDIPRVRKEPDAALLPGPGDTLLMLDSSWDIQSRGFNSLHTARLRGASIISCLYDTVPLYYPAFCGDAMPQVFTRWLLAALGYSTGFVCISRTVADELVSLLAAIRFPRPMRIAWWPLGADVSPAGLRAAAFSTGGRRRFLMVGTLEPRKGHRVVLDAFDQLWAAGEDAELVIIGKHGWGADALVDRLRQHREMGHRLSWRSSVDDKELALLYASADALIAASFAEGFGLPIVEAAAVGCAVIAADIPVFREVASPSQGVRFFEAGSPRALAEAVRSSIHSPSVTPPPAQAAARWTTWAESARELERILREDDWYRVYRPAQTDPMAPITALGDISMFAPLTLDDRAYILDLVEGPYTEAGHPRWTVRLENRSSRLWSSRPGGANGTMIELGCRVVAADCTTVLAEGQRSAIPLVLPPGQAAYLAVRAPVRRHPQGRFLEIGVVDNGIWWPKPLRAELPT